MRFITLILATVLLAAGLILPAASAASAKPIEDYASYDGQKYCNPKAKPGAVKLSRWLVKQYGGRAGGISRACNVGGQSEHKEGRAVDWMMDADNKREKAQVRRMMERLFATDKAGNKHALARRMGIMYIIWDDQLWGSYRAFEASDYRPCANVKKCSKTTRHRDHVHVSLSRKGGRGETSWYLR